MFICVCERESFSSRYQVFKKRPRQSLSNFQKKIQRERQREKRETVLTVDAKFIKIVRRLNMEILCFKRINTMFAI